MTMPTVAGREIDLLLVEDSETAVEVIRSSIAAAGPGYRLSVAQSLAEARSWLDHSTPDLIIADLMLPDGKGTDLLPLDRDMGTFPIIVLTAGGNEMEAVEA